MNDICIDLRSLGQQSLGYLTRINLWQDQLTEQDYDMIVNVFKDKKTETGFCRDCKSKFSPNMPLSGEIPTFNTQHLFLFLKNRGTKCLGTNCICKVLQEYLGYC